MMDSLHAHYAAQWQILQKNRILLHEIEQRLIAIRETNRELQRKLMRFNCTAICYRYRTTYPMSN